MIKGIAQIALLVREYDEALDFYCRKLGFIVVEDKAMAHKRWIRLAAPGGGGSEILLSKAVDDAQKAVIGKQAGGRVLFFMHTDDFAGDARRLNDHGIPLSEGPFTTDYGTVGVFSDLYGNRIDLIEPKA